MDKNSSNKSLPEHLVAVITGDIVNSSSLNLDQRKRLQVSFGELSQTLMKSSPNIPYSIENFRGDSWQLILSSPITCMRTSVMIRSFFRALFSNPQVDSRIAIGIGRINFIPEGNFTAGDGPAFTISGHALDTLKNRAMVIKFERINPFVNLLDGYLLLLDQLISSWSSGQSQSVFWSLQGYKQKEIAKLWIPKPISQAAVSKHLFAAHWDACEKSIKIIDEQLKRITQNY